MEKTKIGIIIPCYNEEKDIAKNALKVQEYLLNNLSDYHFDLVLINDGSKDNTKAMIKGIKDVFPLTYEVNKGKGFAIKTGIEYALKELNDDYFIFMDADLSTDLSALSPCISLLKEGNDVVIGSRYDKESNIAIKQPLKRRIISKISRIIIKMMFHFKVKETQCGFKGINRDIATIILEKGKMERFSFDVEWLYIAKLNKRTIKSFPVVWRDDRTSTVSPMKASIRFFKDLFKIKRNKKHYLL